MAAMCTDTTQLPASTSTEDTFAYMMTKLFETIKVIEKGIKILHIEAWGYKESLLQKITELESHASFVQNHVHSKQLLLSNAQQLVEILKAELSQAKDSCKCKSNAEQSEKSKEPISVIEVIDDEDSMDTEADEDEHEELQKKKKRRSRADITNTEQETQLDKKSKRIRKPRILEDMIYRDTSEDSEGESTRKLGTTTQNSQTQEIEDVSANHHSNFGRYKRIPEKSIHLLQEWILTHWYHPYPSDEEKVTLCADTGLSLMQLNNWFTNSRRRMLKRAIERHSDLLEKQYPKPEKLTLPITHQTAHYPHSFVCNQPSNQEKTPKSPPNKASESVVKEESSSKQKPRKEKQVQNIQKQPLNQIPYYSNITLSPAPDNSQITPIQLANTRTISQAPIMGVPPIPIISRT